MSTAWVVEHVPGFAQLSQSERDVIAEFALLWPIFEARILSTQGSAKGISDAVKSWELEGTLDTPSYDKELAYFQSRYVANGEVTQQFEGLKLRANDQPALVRAVLDGSNVSAQNRLTVVLIIVLRYRNNLFHGVKWQYQLADQFDNFTNANSVLRRVLEQHGNLQGS